MISKLFFILMLAAGVSTKAWNLNDISYLYPKPTAANVSVAFLTPRSEGSLGLLLPPNVYSLLPEILIFGDSNQSIYDLSLRAVAVRIDPCVLGSSPCRSELRIVWQPLKYDSIKKVWEFQDGAVHSFYLLKNVQMSSLLNELKKLKIENQKNGINTEKLFLQSHPAFKGNQSEIFAKSLQQSFLKVAGAANLFKITFMATIQPGNWWRFGGFEKVTDQWTAISIPRMATTTQDIFNDAVGDTHDTDLMGFNMDSSIVGLPSDYPPDDNLLPIINDGFRKNSPADLPLFKTKLNSIEKFLNPKLTNPTNLDCATCHYADPARGYMFRRFPQLKVDINENTFKNPDTNIFNLQNNSVTPVGTRVLRAFGYFNQKEAISQRTINESALIADWLNKNGL